MENQFLERLKVKIIENISNEQFGVSELANEIGMSRSNLLRKVKTLTGLSVSQFIRKIRLNEANKLLKDNDITVSEVSYKVGFSSPSYFIKCFREQFGFSPGEIHNQLFNEENDQRKEIDGMQGNKKNYNRLIFSATLLILVLLVLFEVIIPQTLKKTTQKKSIAVLPFINDSADSTNVYLVNGLMESILNNLQKIEGLRVISRTSVEKYRNSNKTIPEIAKELNVAYVVEGSGQKLGNRVLLNIQLINNLDNHLWAQQYNRETSNIFSLQNEISKEIVEIIEVILSPEEEQRLNEIPTQNPVAYDYFLKGYDLLQKGKTGETEKAIPFFKKAISEDEKFARAHAAIAISYYVLDDSRQEKIYTDSINYYADKALLLDPRLPQSLIAKGLYYMNTRAFEKAVPYFEKTLEIHPNNDLVLIFLVELYTNHIPNTEKYLEYVLRGNKLDITEYDSTLQSYNYLHLSNALVQSGFVYEAEKFINKSIDYFPGNLYSQYVKAYIVYAKNRDLLQLQNSLVEVFQKDTTRLDVLQEVGKIFYYQKKYAEALTYYQPFYQTKKAYGLDIYHAEDIKIARVFAENGFQQEANELLNAFINYAKNDKTIYKNMLMAMYYAQINETEKCLDYLQLFSEENNFHYWTILFTPIDPLFENLSETAEFKEIIIKIEKKFQQNHKRLKENLHDAF